MIKLIEFKINNNEFYIGAFETLQQVKRFLLENRQEGDIIRVNDIVTVAGTYKDFKDLFSPDKTMNKYLSNVFERVLP